MPRSFEEYNFMKNGLRTALVGAQPPTDPIWPEFSGIDDGERLYDVGERLYAEIQAACQQNPDSFQPGAGVRHGCSTIYRGLERCYASYNEHCQQTGQDFDPDELNSALVHPKTVRFITMIAGMQNDRAQIFELWFGLACKARTTMRTELLFNPEESCFEPNPSVLSDAEIDAQVWAAKHQQTEDNADPLPNQCPARSLIPQLWGRAVDIAVEETANWSQMRDQFTPVVRLQL
jgi:hypothetical protein